MRFLRHHSAWFEYLSPAFSLWPQRAPPFAYVRVTLFPFHNTPVSINAPEGCPLYHLRLPPRGPPTKRALNRRNPTFRANAGSSSPLNSFDLCRLDESHMTAAAALRADAAQPPVLADAAAAAVLALGAPPPTCSQRPLPPHSTCTCCALALPPVLEHFFFAVFFLPF